MGAAPLTPSWHAERTPDAPAIIMGTSGEFVKVRPDWRIAHPGSPAALRAQGVHEGDTIAILMENNRQYLEVAWAAQRSGLRYTAINNHLRPAEVQYVLDDCGAVVSLFPPRRWRTWWTAWTCRVIPLQGLRQRGRLPSASRPYDDFLASRRAGTA